MSEEVRILTLKAFIASFSLLEINEEKQPDEQLLVMENRISKDVCAIMTNSSFMYSCLLVSTAQLI